jgi:putative oxidoreductase
MDFALLIVRLLLGLGLAAHGAQKLFGWYGGSGVNKTGEFFVQLGWNQGRFFAAGAGLGEFGGGVLVALGFLGPIGPALMILVMLVAALTVHVHNGFFVTKNGWEMPMLYAVGAMLLAFTGFGKYSLDHFLGLDWYSSSRLAWMAIAAAVVVALINVMLRRPPKATGA